MKQIFWTQEHAVSFQPVMFQFFILKPVQFAFVRS